MTFFSSWVPGWFVAVALATTGCGSTICDAAFHGYTIQMTRDLDVAAAAAPGYSYELCAETCASVVPAFDATADGKARVGVTFLVHGSRSPLAVTLTARDGTTVVARATGTIEYDIGDCESVPRKSEI